MSRFPAYRPRRLRRSEALRRLVRETRVTLEQLVQPLFVVPGRAAERPVESMPGIAQLSVERAAEEARRLSDAACPPCCSAASPSGRAPAAAARPIRAASSRALAALREAAPG